MKDYVLKTSGGQYNVVPKKGRVYTLKELQEFVGGYVQIIKLHRDNLLMVVNEDGHLKGLPHNREASALYYSNTGSQEEIVGDVLVCDVFHVD